MSDNPDTGDQPEVKEDPLKNYKAEMDRKLGGFESKFDQLSQVNQQLLNQVQQLAQAATPPATSDEFEDLWIDNPKEAARRIKEETTAEIRKDMEKQSQLQQKQTRILSELTQKFPELNDSGSELTQKAVEIYNALDADEQRDPRSYKLAVAEAAVDLGIQPASKRKKRQADDDSFAVSGSSGTKAKPQSAGVDPRTIEFAKLIGMDVSNEDTMKKLEKRSQRKNWSTYQ